MRPIIIVTPDYTHSSNGIAALHHICHTINSLGGDSRLLMLTDKAIVGGLDHQTNPAWNTPNLQECDKGLVQEGIVIYPEMVKGNPLNAPRVVRWLGHKEGALWDNSMDAQPDDYIMAHSKVLRPNADYVLFYPFMNSCFNSDGAPPEKRVLNATYIGKGYLFGDVGIIKNTLWIERKWPSTQEQLAFILRHVACFYTWDSWSATNVNAIMCGAVPFFLNYKPFTQEDVDGTELGIIPRLDKINSKFDLVKFTEQREALIERMITLQASWLPRVKELMDRLNQRYGG